MTADLGVSTYDAVALVLCNKYKIVRFAIIRICTDLVCVILGVILFLSAGNTVSSVPTVAGIGTIITAFFMGPLIEFFNQKIARPLIAEKTSALPGSAVVWGYPACPDFYQTASFSCNPGHP